MGDLYHNIDVSMKTRASSIILIGSPSDDLGSPYKEMGFPYNIYGKSI